MDDVVIARRTSPDAIATASRVAIGLVVRTERDWEPVDVVPPVRAAGILAWADGFVGWWSPSARVGVGVALLRRYLIIK